MIYNYPKKGTIPLGVHMMQTQEFLTKALQMTADMIPSLVAVQKIKRERELKKLSDPIIKGEGAESAEEMECDSSITEQGLGTDNL